LPLQAFEWHIRFSQQARWTSELRHFLLNRLGLSGALRILEVGCGTGAILADFKIPTESASSLVAMRNPRLYGLDFNRPFLKLAAQNLPLIRLSEGDGLHLPFASACFDLACCHFLLLWVNDPYRVVAEMHRVTRSGGFVVAFAEPDYGGRIDYPPELNQLGLWQQQALRRQGAEPQIGRKLSAIFHAAGLKNVKTGVLGGQWSGAPSLDDWKIEWQVLQDDLHDQTSFENFGRLRTLDWQAWQNGERVLYVPTFYALGLVGEEHPQ
jgi:ubiquinone/menaquinone biosynthesis C-methylase UbiE